MPGMISVKMPLVGSSNVRT